LGFIFLFKLKKTSRIHQEFVNENQDYKAKIKFISLPHKREIKKKNIKKAEELQTPIN
jgi:hypothetical protein